MRDLMRLAGGQRINPEIARSGGAVVIVEKTCAVFAECRMATGRLVYALWNRQGRRFAGGEIALVDIFIAIDVGAEGDVLAVEGEFAAANFPFVFGEPFNLARP